MALGRIFGLRVNRGDNIMSTCYQYAVVDTDRDKILNIKVYDKLLDLMSREATHMVGSRAKTILGCEYKLDAFNRRLCSN